MSSKILPILYSFRRCPYAMRSRLALMASEAGKTIYRQRVEVECVNARARQWNIHQFLVRGSRKASCIAYLFALANNILQGRRLELMAT